ncbi:MAG TPA: hypothetical protein VD999_00755 [Vitreimonas sp.]|nr:hypothetical protein [Vitreimonas sp.]
MAIRPYNSFFQRSSLALLTLATFSTAILYSKYIGLHKTVYAQSETTTVTTNNTGVIEQPSSTIMIINQVRGSECCDVGSLEALKKQITIVQGNAQPAYFTVRYDALTEPEFVSTLRAAHRTTPALKLGGLLEITPSWATAAGVEYKGTPDTWYEAQYSMLIGYAPEERRRLVDTYMADFKQQFGEYPELTTAWMIDTPTLYYAHDQYGVKIHQITREQWGTDSYTLYGGPPHYPYPASRNWAFVPDYNEANPLFIVRQTVTDPLKNYGDTSSSFTSQPNDYARDGKDHLYFLGLMAQVASQPATPGWAVLGLENSMPGEFQAEYEKQLKNVASSTGPAGKQLLLNVNYFDSNNINKISNDHRINIYSGIDILGDTHNEAVWITTPTYRIRLRKYSDKIWIDDFRVFDARLTDPYSNTVAVNKGHWVVPYLLDGSLWHHQPTKRPLKLRLFGPPEVPNLAPQPQSDLTDQVTRLELPNLAPGTAWKLGRTSSGQATLEYQTAAGQAITVFFEDSRINWSGLSPESFTYHPLYPTQVPLDFLAKKDGFQLRWLIDEKVGWGINNTCRPAAVNETGLPSCEWTFTLQPDLLAQAREQQYPFLFPETRPRELDEKNSLVYAHNRYAIAGRNPVRIVIVPYDKAGFPTTLADPATVIASPPPAYISESKKELNESLEFIDLVHNSPQKTALTVSLSDSVTKNITVYFAPNCKVEKLYCLTHPRQTWWYLNTVVRDKIRAQVLGEPQ